MWVFFVSDMQNLINGPDVKVILVGWVKLNGQKVLLLVGQAHLLSEIKILCECGKKPEHHHALKGLTTALQTMFLRSDDSA